jgi:HK97 gp10 family phage protein
MAVTQTHISGLAEIGKVLDQLPDRIERRVLQNAVNAGARLILSAVKEKAPTSEEPSVNSWKYGSILQNLKVRTITKARKTARGAYVSTGNAFWAVFYEFGTRHQPARPFMRPAFDESQDWAAQAIVDKLTAGIEKEATTLAGPYANAKKSLGVR